VGESVLAQSDTTERTIRAGQEALAGRRRGLRAFLPFAGPAVVASVAYIDPGNVATNIQAGAGFGYMLLWVVVLANLMAMLFQALSAKLGIVTGMSLAQLCRRHLPRPLVRVMWVISEIAAMATDLAEFLGAAIGFSLLAGLPLMVGLVVTAIATFALLTLQRRGFRPVEVAIGSFVGLISICYIIELAIAPPDWAAFLHGAAVPRLAGPESLLLAVGIIGATVMPHAIYLHSSLTQNRMPAASEADRRRILRYSNLEVVLALGVAGLVNMAMLAMAATMFHATGHSDIAQIETAYHTLVPLMGGAAASVFMLSLLASGLSSSVVGTMAGQVIMQDFVGFRIPLWVRRAVTMLPAFIVVALGATATDALVMSQVVLSLTLPVPMLALLWLTGRRSVMGSFVNSPLVTVLAWGAALVVLALNAILLIQTAGLPIPFLPAG
jgi:manganese transport protein